MTDPDDQDSDDTPDQRVVSAADSSPLRTTAASSVFTSWMKPGTAPPAVEDEPAADDPPAPTTNPTTTGEDETMATRKKAGAKRTRKANKGGSPQLQICSALLEHGHLSREQIAEACSDLNGAQISSALNNAKSHGRVEYVEYDEAGKVFQLTKVGKAWIATAIGEQPPEEAAPKKRGAAGRSKAHARRGRKVKEEATEPPAAEDEDTPSFRCAVMSDGCFFIAKDGNTIELEPEEHKQMLHYLERMAETA